MTDPKVLNRDDWVLCRGMTNPRSRIVEIEALYGAELVPDRQAQLLDGLDHQLAIFRFRNGYHSNLPNRMMVTKTDIFFYAEHTFPMIVLGMAGGPVIPTENTSRPIWFRVRRNLNR